MTDEFRSFPSELRRRRLEAGLSLAGLSAAVHYSKGYLSKIENGVVRAGPDIAMRCDAALHAGGRLAALSRPRSDDPLAARGRERPDPPGPAAAPWALSAAARQEITPARFRVLFEQSRDLGLAVSPAIVLPMVAMQARTLDALAAAAREPARSRLLELAGRVSEYAGWMSQEAGDEESALTFTNTAADMAAACGDRALALYTRVRQADLALYRGEPTTTVRLCLDVQADRGAPRRVAGLAAQREAQGHALAGDPDRWRRAMDRAEDLLAEPHEGGAPPLGSTSVPNTVELVTGWCLLDLGRPEAAAEILDLAVPLIPPRARRAAVRFGIRRALAHAAAAEVDLACQFTDELLHDAEAVDSATIRTDLRRLDLALSRWTRRPSVAAVRAAISESVRSGRW